MSFEICQRVSERQSKGNLASGKRLTSVVPPGRRPGQESKGGNQQTVSKKFGVPRRRGVALMQSVGGPCVSDMDVKRALLGPPGR